MKSYSAKRSSRFISKIYGSPNPRGHFRKPMYRQVKYLARNLRNVAHSFHNLRLLFEILSCENHTFWHQIFNADFFSWGHENNLRGFEEKRVFVYSTKFGEQKGLSAPQKILANSSIFWKCSGVFCTEEGGGNLQVYRLCQNEWWKWESIESQFHRVKNIFDYLNLNRVLESILPWHHFLEICGVVYLGFISFRLSLVYTGCPKTLNLYFVCVFSSDSVKHRALNVNVCRT